MSCGFVTSKMKAATPRPASLAKRKTALAASQWFCVISQTARSLSGNSSSPGTAKATSAAAGGSHSKNRFRSAFSRRSGIMPDDPGDDRFEVAP